MLYRRENPIPLSSSNLLLQQFATSGPHDHGSAPSYMAGGESEVLCPHVAPMHASLPSHGDAGVLFCLGVLSCYHRRWLPCMFLLKNGDTDTMCILISSYELCANNICFLLQILIAPYFCKLFFLCCCL